MHALEQGDDARTRPARRPARVRARIIHAALRTVPVTGTRTFLLPGSDGFRVPLEDAIS